MEVRFIKPEEAVDYLKVSAASFIWKFDKEVDKEVEMPVLGAFHEGKLIAGMEVYGLKCNYCTNPINMLVLDGICSQPECRRMGGVRAMFDEIGSRLKIKQLQVEKEELLEALQMFYKVFFLGEEM